MNAVDVQMVHQIQQSTPIQVWTNDFDYPERVILYRQEEGGHLVFPGFGGSTMAIRQALVEWLEDLFTDEQQFNTDPDVIRWPGGWDSFIERLLHGPVILSRGYCVIARGEDRGWLNAGYDMTRDYERAVRIMETARAKRPDLAYRIKAVGDYGDGS